MKAIIPISLDDLGGPSITVDEGFFEVLLRREDVVLVEFNSRPVGVSWFDSFKLLFCQQLRDPDAIQVIRQVTDDERRLYRVPLWIQGDDVPMCCDRPMFFVGQIDDDRILYGAT